MEEKNMVDKSNVDIAFDIISKSNEAITFANLWSQLVEEKGYSQEDASSKIGAFYTALLLDGRFINLGDNTWNLRSRYTFDKVTIDVNDCYSEEEEKDPEEIESEKNDDEDFSADLEEDFDEDEEKSEYEEEEM
jgi:DNA-directed RNA polymerase subunit delta